MSSCVLELAASEPELADRLVPSRRAVEVASGLPNSPDMVVTLRLDKLKRKDVLKHNYAIEDISLNKLLRENI